MACVQIHGVLDVFEPPVSFENISMSDTNCYIVKDSDNALVIRGRASPSRSVEVSSLRASSSRATSLTVLSSAVKPTKQASTGISRNRSESAPNAECAAMVYFGYAGSRTRALLN